MYGIPGILRFPRCMREFLYSIEKGKTYLVLSNYFYDTRCGLSFTLFWLS